MDLFLDSGFVWFLLPLTTTDIVYNETMYPYQDRSHIVLISALVSAFTTLLIILVCVSVIHSYVQTTIPDTIEKSTPSISIPTPLKQISLSPLPTVPVSVTPAKLK